MKHLICRHSLQYRIYRFLILFRSNAKFVEPHSTLARILSSIEAACHILHATIVPSPWINGRSNHLTRHEEFDMERKQGPSLWGFCERASESGGCYALPCICLKGVKKKQLCVRAAAPFESHVNFNISWQCLHSHLKGEILKVETFWVLFSCSFLLGT